MVFMKRIISVILALISVLIVFSGCGRKVSNYSVEEHMQRISERVRNTTWLIEDFEDFDVYPLYGKDEKLKFFLLEFNPHGFVFIFVQDEPPVLMSCLYAHKSMYIVSADYYYKEETWFRYVADKNGPPLSDFVERAPSAKKGTPIFDAKGEIIKYDKSPYYVSGNVNEKKYVFETEVSSEFICAVKKGGKFINLISGTELPDADSYNSIENATLYGKIIANRRFDL